MSDKTKNPGGSWREALLPAAEVRPGAAGDLAALGQLQSAFEAGAESLGEGGPEAELRLLLLRAAELTQAVIMGDVAGGAESFAFGLAARLLEAGDAGLVVAVAAAEEELTELLPGGSEDKSNAEQPLPEDRVTLAGEEDAVIYTEFVTESGEHLERIESRVLELENSGYDAALVNDMFRCFHSMKGAAGFLGLTCINNLCHEVETLLDRARKLTLRIDREVIDILLASIDAAKKLLAAVDERLRLLRSGVANPAPSTVCDIRPLVAVIKLLLERKPPAPVAAGSAEPDPGKVGGMLLAEGAITGEQLAAALEAQRKPVGQLLVEMGATTPDKVEGALTRQKAEGKGAGSIKIDTEKLDLLLEMAGELVIAESQVAQDEAVSSGENMRLHRNVGNLSKITRNLQELVMSMRMVPLRQTFQKMFRLVRDTARKTGKEAELYLAGEETEIDKTIIEEIADPLVHLLRNAVDHGVELPDKREAAGKPRAGSIRLSARHEGGNVVIEVRDDGKGLDRERILEKAKQKNLLREGATYTEEEIFDLVFLPGFSTHDVASEISGRGVGMDVVRQNIERLGGRVEIQSEKGAGSLFRIRLPLTMAIADGMVVRSGAERYIIPTLGIEESIRPAAGQVNSVVGRGEMVMVRGDLVQLLRLGEIFHVNGTVENPVDGLVIIVNHEGRRYGILVDELLGQQQVVIKNLGSRLKGVGGVSGACILGDGRIGLILDVGGMLKKAFDN